MSWCCESFFSCLDGSNRWDLLGDSAGFDDMLMVARSFGRFLFFWLRL